MRRCTAAVRSARRDVARRRGAAAVPLTSGGNALLINVLRRCEASAFLGHVKAVGPEFHYLQCAGL